jgi:hypothetical protein
MEDVDRSKSTIRELASWILKKEKMNAITTDIGEEATNAVRSAD